MAFVQAKCENCGGILTVDDSLKAANCPYCGIAYIVQDSINHYNSYTKIDHLHAAVVNVSNEESSEGTLKAADTFILLGKFKEAEEKYKKVTSMAPQNYKGWTGLLVACTNNFSKRIKSEKELKLLGNYSRSAKLLSNAEERENVTAKFETYVDEQAASNQEELEKYQEELNNTIDRMEQLKSEKADLVVSFESVNEEYNKIVNDKINGNYGPSAASILLWIGAANFGLFAGVAAAMGGNTFWVVLLSIATIACIWGAVMITWGSSDNQQKLSSRKLELKNSIDEIQAEYEALEGKRQSLETSMEIYK